MDQPILSKFLGKRFDIVNKIKKFSQSEPLVKSVLVHGPYSRNEETNITEINLLIVVNFESTKRLKNKFNDLLENESSYFLKFEKKIIFYSNNNNEFIQERIKISLDFIEDLNEINSFYKNFQSKIVPINELIILDKISIEKQLNQILKIDINKGNYLVEKIELKINEFLDRFELASYKISLGDILGYFMCMVNCYQNLLDLEFINYYNETYDSDSRNDFWSVHLVKRANFFKEYYPNLNISTATLYKEKYVSIFLDILLELILKLNLDLNIDKYEKFLNSIITRDSIWNLRDFCKANPEKLVEGKLYRTSAISRYRNTGNFQKLLETLNIKTIIDLRTPEEMVKYPYKNSLDEFDIKHVSIPIGQKEIENSIELKYEVSNQANSFYEIFPRYYQKEIAKIIKTLLRISYPSMIHCYAGRDRTGIVIAIIQKVLGLSEYEITQDYYCSGSFTSEENINLFFSVVKEYGEIEDFLNHIGISNDEIQKMKEIFGDK